MRKKGKGRGRGKGNMKIPANRDRQNAQPQIHTDYTQILTEKEKAEKKLIS